MTETKGTTILWNFALQTNTKIKRNRQSIVVKDSKKKKKKKPHT